MEKFIISLLVYFVASGPAMLLWNYCLVPAIPNLNPVGWLQMFGIILLFNWLFKSKFNDNEN